MSSILFNSRDPETRWLSNFTRVNVQLDGVIYPSVEHAYQAAKTEKPEERERIRKCWSAVDAKKLGKHVDIRPGWSNLRVEIMRNLLQQKFAQEPFNSLLRGSVGMELIHLAPWDDFWGNGKDGKGQNQQGVLIMEIRDVLLKENPLAPEPVQEKENRSVKERPGSFILLKPGENYSRQEILTNSDTIYVFGDNDLRKGLGGAAKEARGCSNSVGVRVKKAPSTKPEAYYQDEDFDQNVVKIQADLQVVWEKLTQGQTVKCPQEIGNGLAKLSTIAPRTYAFLREQIDQLAGEFSPKQNKIHEDLPLKKIISGGQTGADQAGLVAGQRLGLETGGWIPQGYRTENGSDPSLACFNLQVHESKDWSPRTIQNVLDSDGTVWFGDSESPGGRLTLRTCREKNRPFLINPSTHELRKWLVDHHIQVLNIAGNRESKTPGIFVKVLNHLKKALEKS